MAHLGDHEAFLEKFDQQVAHKKHLVAIGDDARWIWEYWNSYHPEAVQILDFFHLMEKIGLWAVLLFKEGPQRKDWIDHCERLLLNNESAEVVALITVTHIGLHCHHTNRFTQNYHVTLFSA